MLQSCYEKSSLNLKDRSTLLVEIKMIKLNVEAYLHPNIYHAWQNASILPYLYRASDLGIEIVLFLSVCLSIIFFPSFSLVGLWCRTRFLWVKTELCRLKRFCFNCIFINHSTNQDDLWSACYFLSLKKKKKRRNNKHRNTEPRSAHKKTFFLPFHQQLVGMLSPCPFTLLSANNNVLYFLCQSTTSARFLTPGCKVSLSRARQKVHSYKYCWPVQSPCGKQGSDACNR